MRMLQRPAVQSILAIADIQVGPSVSNENGIAYRAVGRLALPVLFYLPALGRSGREL
jgi:hypothetical protein